MVGQYRSFEDSTIPIDQETSVPPDNEPVIYDDSEIEADDYSQTRYIRMTDDAKRFVVECGETIILDLNGFSISNREKNEDAIAIKPGGKLFITGEGTVENTGGYALIFNEGECYISGKASFINDTSNYSIINHGKMVIAGDVHISCLKTSSSLVQNGYYEYDSGDHRTGYVDGWEYPELEIYSGDYSGGRISVKNSDAGLCTIYGGTFYGAPIAALKNWGTMDVYGGDFTGGNSCIVLARRLKNEDRCLGLTRIHGGTFHAPDVEKPVLFGISAGTDMDTFYTHGDTFITGGAFEGFVKKYSVLTSPRALLNIADDVVFDPQIQ